MRAARLLQMLLILQNRGRQTSTQLAEELEVSPRTILRDVDAMTEAGLPIIVHQGNAGGIELGFNYRTRLTGLAADEAEALAVLLANRPSALAQLDMDRAAKRAAAKLVESLPDLTRARMALAQRRFAFASSDPNPDPRIPALAKAIRNATIVRLRYPTPDTRIVHPTGLTATDTGWQLHCATCPDTPIPDTEWGNINISAHQFAGHAAGLVGGREGTQ